MGGATTVLDIVLNKEEIGKILPHQGRMLLLDRVEITAERIRGEFTVTEEACEGHAVFDGKSVLRGSDLLDMAAQLLGVWVANAPNLGPNYTKCMVKGYGGATFLKAISPPELLTMEIDIENIRVELSSGGLRSFITGEKFIARVGKEKVAEIFPVKLRVF